MVLHGRTSVLRKKLQFLLQLIVHCIVSSSEDS